MAEPAGRVARLELAALAAILVVKVVVHVATNGNYGFQTDELYYLDSGRHPDWGYVDYPPVTPMIARLALLLVGPTTSGLRLFSTLAGVLVIVLVWLAARELGGGVGARLLAAFAALTSPMILGSNWLFQTVSFDQLTWIATLVPVVAAVRRDEPRLWLVAGLALGVGLETKYTITALALGIGLGLLVTPVRAHLRTPWPWLGAAVALVILAPNLVWQAGHEWASVQYVLNHRHDIGTTPVSYVVEQLLLLGPLGLPLWLAGWARLLRDRRDRMLAIAVAVPFVLFLFVGKEYYPGPIHLLLLAAGACWVEGWAARRRRWPWVGVPVALGLQAILLSPILLPVLSEPAMARSTLPAARRDFADTVGWPDLVRQVGAVYRSLPPDERRSAVIIGDNVGISGAVDTFGPSQGLPAAYSPQLSGWYWLPPHLEPAVVVLVGLPSTDAGQICDDPVPAGRIHNRYGLPNLTEGQPIYVCHHLRRPLDVLWPKMKRFA